METLYTCPVCAYPEMTDPVHEGNICPCCGTEFGYDDDLGVTYEQLRLFWIEQGMSWFSRVVQPPLYWDPAIQLLEGGYDIPEVVSDTTNQTEQYELVA